MSLFSFDANSENFNQTAMIWGMLSTPEKLIYRLKKPRQRNETQINLFEWVLLNKEQATVVYRNDRETVKDGAERFY